MGPACDSVSDVWSFPKLTGQNYYAWSEQMKAALQARYLWQYVSGDEPQPPKPPKSPPSNFFYSANYVCWEKAWDRHRHWVQNDNAAIGLIKGAIDPSQWGHVSETNSSKDMWD
ncbi:hypothetical protein P691DRAFT_689042, partial [Macrolepiota fuliginosa MF-IS2]